MSYGFNVSIEFINTWTHHGGVTLYLKRKAGTSIFPEFTEPKKVARNPNTPIKVSQIQFGKLNFCKEDDLHFDRGGRETNV